MYNKLAKGLAAPLFFVIFEQLIRVENVELLELSLLEELALGIIGFLLAIQLFYYLYFYAAVLFVRQKEEKSLSFVPVSVIICAKNEADNLRKLLPSILDQKYPEFQVVVINDCSSDETEDVLMELKKKYDYLHFSTIKEDPVFKHGKKLAVLMGVKAAKYDHLLFTDADCMPDSDIWLASMARNFSDRKQLVLGTYNIKKEKGLLNHLQCYENLNAKMLYLGFALRGKPYMGVGGNLAYHRKLFFDNKGFAGHYHIPSGDDDLFVNSVATSTNTQVEFSKESQVTTEGKATWKQWITQKRRHMGAGSYYKAKHKWMLFLNTLSLEMFYVLATAAICFGILPYVFGAFLLIRIITGALIINFTAHKLGQRKFYVSFLWYDLVLPAIYLTLVFKNKLRPSGVRWK